MTPPTWPLVPAQLQAWVETVQAIPERSLQGVVLPELLAQVHNHFEKVHPFIDGNGRTGRLALNLIVVRMGYPPIVVLKGQRSRYLQALAMADRDDFGPLGRSWPGL